MALSLLNPIQDSQAFDVITIAGKVSPGKIEISDPTRSYSWDIKVGKGAFGSTTTFTGRVPAEFSVTFTLWKKDHFDAWEAFVEKLRYNPTKIRYNPETLWVSGVDAVDIFHPILVNLEIYSVVVKKITGLTHKGKGVWQAKIDFLEWFPPPKLSVIATPVGSTPLEGLPPNPAINQRQNQLTQLQNQAKAAGVL